MNTNTEIPGGWDRSAFGGVALIVLGLMAIIFPVAASITTTYVVGWVLIAAAFTHLLLGWRGDNAGSMLWTGLISVAYVSAGIAMLVNPLWGIATIALIVGATLGINGMLSVAAYFMGERVSRWVLINGVISMALAVILVSGWLSYSVSIIGTLVGVNLLMAGVFDFAASIEREGANHFRQL